MKKILFISLILVCFGLNAQDGITVSDDVTVTDTVINGQTYFSLVQSTVTQSEFLDSASFLSASVIPIANEYFKVRQAIKLRFENTANKLRLQNDPIIDSVSGSNFLSLMLDTSFAHNVVNDYAKVWRLTYDTINTFLYWDGALTGSGAALAKEIDNSTEMINQGAAPSYVAQGVRIRFNPYNRVASRVVLLLHNGSSYDNVWGGFEEVGLIGPIFNEEGQNTGRKLWHSDRRVRNIRLIQFPGN